MPSVAGGSPVGLNSGDTWVLIVDAVGVCVDVGPLRARDPGPAAAPAAQPELQGAKG